MAADDKTTTPDGAPDAESDPSVASRRAARPSRPPADRLPFDRIVPDLLKRGLEAGRGVGDSLFSRDLATSVVAQLGEAREGVVNVVGQEVGRFLRQADIASEIRNVLAGLEIEANVKLKFRRTHDTPEPGAQKAEKSPKAPSPPPVASRDSEPER